MLSPVTQYQQCASTTVYTSLSRSSVHFFGCLFGVVTTFFTASRAHLRRAGPDGPSREQRGRTQAVERERAARVTRRRRPGFTQGSRRRGAAASPRPSDASPTARRLPRTAPPVTGRLRSPPYPAAATASTTTRPYPRAECADRHVKMSQRPGRNAAHCLGRPLHPQGHPKILSTRSAKTAPQKASSGPTLARGASADPAGLTARARPEARPETRAANLSSTSREDAEVTRPLLANADAYCKLERP
jgi:hypothetical protein